MSPYRKLRFNLRMWRRVVAPRIKVHLLCQLYMALDR